MKSDLLKISLKYGLILGGLYVIIGLVSMFMFKPDDFSYITLAILSFLSWTFPLIIFPMSHYEYNKKNGNFISFGDAILIGLIIVGVFFIMSTVYSFIGFELVMKERMHEFTSDVSQEYEVDASHGQFSFGSFALASFLVAVLQIAFLFLVITFEAQWKIYKKAGKDGWASIIPFYNLVVLLEIVKKPSWWIIMLLIPFVNVIFYVWMMNLLAKRFGKDEDFTIGLLLLPFICFPLLGMSKAEYIDGE